jgi:hypothetical protein
MTFLSSFIKEEISGNETGAWIIRIIRNGLKCDHISSKFTEYFEADELAGMNAFTGKDSMTPLQVFERMMHKTPHTKGFVYKNWDIIIHEEKGFIIRPRLNKDKVDIEKYKEYNNEERYKTNESLMEIEMINFLQYIEEPNEEIVNEKD